MEKGFNDDELADIMNEIESLEQEFAEDNTLIEDKEPNLDEVAASVMQMANEEEDEDSFTEEDFISEHDGQHHEESDLLHDIAAMPVESIVPSQSVDKYDDDSHHNVHELAREGKNMKKTNSTTAKTAMNFSVEGDMKLDLSFLVSGKEIKLTISENGFEIELEGGAKFSLPIHSEVRGEKAA